MLFRSEPAWQWDWRPLLHQLLADLAEPQPPEAMALGLHQALADGLGELALRLEAQTLLLAGGCFQNRVLLELSAAALEHRGIRALWSQQLPSNDAALPVGQLLAAAAGGGPQAHLPRL